MINKVTKKDIDEAGNITRDYCENFHADVRFYPQCFLLTIEVSKKLGGLQTIKNLWMDSSIDWISAIRKKYGGDGLVGLEGHGWYKYTNKSPQIGDACVISKKIDDRTEMYSVGFWNSDNWMTVNNHRYCVQNMSDFSEIARLRKKQ